MKKRLPISLPVLLICLSIVFTFLLAPPKAWAGYEGQGAIAWNTELPTWAYFGDPGTNFILIAGLDPTTICPNPPYGGELASYHIVKLPQNDGQGLYTAKMDNLTTSIWDASSFTWEYDLWNFVCSQVANGIVPLVTGVSSGTFMDTNPYNIPGPRAISYGGELNGSGLSPNGEEFKIQMVLRVIGKIYEDGTWEILNNQIKISLK